MNRRRFVAPLVVTAAVGVGGIAGAAIGVPTISGAQESTDDPAAEDSRPLRHGPVSLDAAAEALGVDVSDLMGQLRDGSTIAEVAEAQGIDVDAVIDAMVADVVERTGRSEEEVRERITRLVNEGFGRAAGGRGHDRPGHAFGGHGFGGHMFGGPGLDVAADALGIETSDLAQALGDGQTIAEIAAEQGVDVESVIDAMVAEARERITDFVNDGPKRPDRTEAPESGSFESSDDTEDAAA